MPSMPRQCYRNVYSDFSFCREKRSFVWSNSGYDYSPAELEFSPGLHRTQAKEYNGFDNGTSNWIDLFVWHLWFRRMKTLNSIVALTFKPTSKVHTDSDVNYRFLHQQYLHKIDNRGAECNNIGMKMEFLISGFDKALKPGCTCLNNLKYSNVITAMKF